jgi:hypothetical protein
MSCPHGPTRASPESLSFISSCSMCSMIMLRLEPKIRSRIGMDLKQESRSHVPEFQNFDARASYPTVLAARSSEHPVVVPASDSPSVPPLDHSVSVVYALDSSDVHTTALSRVFVGRRRGSQAHVTVRPPSVHLPLKGTPSLRVRHSPRVS